MEYQFAIAKRRPLSVLQLHLLFLLFLGGSLVNAQNGADSNSNQYFNPWTAQDDFTSSCALPPMADSASTNLPPPGYCNAGTSLSDLTTDQLHNLAVAYAPVLFFHPLEYFTLSRVSDTFQNPDLGSIVWSDSISSDNTYTNTYYDSSSNNNKNSDNNNNVGHSFIYDKLNLKSLLKSTRDYNDGMRSNEYYLQHVLDGSYVGGAGFDADNQSLATIYYNAYEWDSSSSSSSNSTEAAGDSKGWVFNYHLYYAFHGYADLVVTDSSNTVMNNDQAKKSPRATYFQAPPLDMHEGDWQSVRVYVCPTYTVNNNGNSNNNNNNNNQNIVGSTPIAVSYQQHFWLQTTDCTKGECVFYENKNGDTSFHPVGFVSLGTHATYPMSSRNIITHHLPSNFMTNLQGVYAVDRTVYRDKDGSIRYFLPQPTNLERLSDPYYIGSNNDKDDSDYWQGFAGYWGQPKVVPPDKDGPICINENQTEYIYCPNEKENGVFHRVLQLLRVAKPTLLTASAHVLYDWATSFYELSRLPPRGPLTQVYYYSQWQAASSPPIWDRIRNKTSTNSENFCQAAFDTIQPQLVPVRVNTLALQNTLLGVVLILFALIAVNVLGFAIHECQRPKEVVLLGYTSAGRFQEPGRQYWWEAHRLVLLYGAVYLLNLLGVFLFVIGHGSMNKVMSRDLNVELTNPSRIALALCIVVLLVDSLVLFAIWIPTSDLHKRVLAAYYHIIADDEKSKYWKQQIQWNLHWGSAILQGAHGLLLAAAGLLSVVVVFGCIIVGLAYGFGLVCNETVGSISDSCFSLGVFDITDIACGEPFQSFCSDVEKNQKRVAAALWGTFLMASCHFYFITSTGAAVMQYRATIGALALFPTRDAYLSRTSVQGSGTNGKQACRDDSTRSAREDDSIITEKVNNTRASRMGMFGTHDELSVSVITEKVNNTRAAKKVPLSSLASLSTSHYINKPAGFSKAASPGANPR